MRASGHDNCRPNQCALNLLRTDSHDRYHAHTLKRVGVRIFANAARLSLLAVHFFDVGKTMQQIATFRTVACIC